jgi:ribosome biogenesis protein ERB1
MASAADDGTVQIFHSTVYKYIFIYVILIASLLMSHPAIHYSDLMRNPLIVPLKVLRGHGVKDGLSVLAIEFHPKQPWIITAGADGIINLFQDV